MASRILVFGGRIVHMLFADGFEPATMRTFVLDSTLTLVGIYKLARLLIDNSALALHRHQQQRFDNSVDFVF